METKEEVIFVGHPVMASRLGGVLLLVLIAVGGIWGGTKSPLLYWLAPIAALAFLIWWLVLKSVIYKVTSQRVIWEEGIIGRKNHEIDIRDIRSMEVDRGVLGMMFRFGTLNISSAGESGIEIIFKDVYDPLGLKEKVHQYKIKAESSND